ncbi:MAG: septum formation initiator family protein [Acidimicrobiia bacterium]|nr:septum formation initiator family protein [Acidimicrobiia bacterium]
MLAGGLTRTARTWLLVGGLAAVGVLFIAVFPARTYLDLRHQRQQMLAQIKTTDDANKALDQRIATLHTNAEIERLAREQYNLVRPGEEAYAILPTRQPPRAPAPPTKPKSSPGWLGRTWNRITSIF